MAKAKSKLNEEIHVEEEPAAEEQAGNERVWTEEFVVAGRDLLDTVMNLVHEATVRRIVIRNADKRILFEIPIVLGVAGIALLPVYSALALIAALVADCSILVERVEETPKSA
jgi:hypothetical protein